MTWSHRGKLSRLALAVNLPLAMGCVETARPTPGAPLADDALVIPFARPSPASFHLPPHRGYTDPRVGGTVRDLVPRGLLPAPAPATLYVLDQLAAPVRDARFDTTLGDRLADQLEAAEDEGRPVGTYGTGALSYAELMGDDVHAGACEFPQVISTVEHEGEEWEITLALNKIESFVGELTLAMGELPEDCVEDLLESAGDIVASGRCSSTDEAMFFPEGSECRACVEAGVGDIAACQAEGRCAAEAPVLESSGGDLWNRFEATILTCAPDHTVPAYVLAHADASGAPPEPFDYTNWHSACVPFWDDYTGEVTHYCQGGADTVRVGTVGVVEGMRREGDDTPWYRQRAYYTPRIEVEGGVDLRYAWEAYGWLGVVSYPVEPDDSSGDGVVDAGDDYFGYQYGSWGLNPLHTRLDGTDATVLDDTFARDWLAAIAMKMATTRDGIGILMANHSRCAADAWDDLDGDGTYRCTRTENPTAGWLGDLAHFAWDRGAGYSYPMPVATMGSTGLPDEKIPGGIVPWIASSPTLGDPEWDDCTWTDTFVPDRAPLPDTPLDYTSVGSTMADTFRYGGHDTDIRVLLYTNFTRDFCPDAVTP
ncbi:MAG: hypothetical protein V4850_25700 [Myxococcota bacterium]